MIRLSLAEAGSPLLLYCRHPSTAQPHTPSFSDLVANRSSAVRRRSIIIDSAAAARRLGPGGPSPAARSRARHDHDHDRRLGLGLRDGALGSGAGPGMLTRLDRPAGSWPGAGARRSESRWTGAAVPGEARLGDSDSPPGRWPPGPGPAGPGPRHWTLLCASARRLGTSESWARGRRRAGPPRRPPRRRRRSLPVCRRESRHSGRGRCGPGPATGGPGRPGGQPVSLSDAATVPVPPSSWPGAIRVLPEPEPDALSFRWAAGPAGVPPAPRPPAAAQGCGRRARGPVPEGRGGPGTCW